MCPAIEPNKPESEKIGINNIRKFAPMGAPPSNICLWERCDKWKEKIIVAKRIIVDAGHEAKSFGYKECRQCKPSQSKTKTKSKAKRKNTLEKEYTCVISANGRYFHRPSCGLVSNIREDNLIGFYSTAEPKSLGLKRCSTCKPWCRFLVCVWRWWKGNIWQHFTQT